MLIVVTRILENMYVHFYHAFLLQFCNKSRLNEVQFVNGQILMLVEQICMLRMNKMLVQPRSLVQID